MLPCLKLLYWGYFLNHFEIDKTDLGLILQRMSLKLPICHQSLARQFHAPRVMNAKLYLWTAVARFLPVKALVCVYIDLASPKSPSLQTIDICQTPSSVLCVCNFYKWELGTKTLAGFISICTIPLLCRYDTTQSTSDAITFPIQRKLTKISSSLKYG